MCAVVEGTLVPISELEGLTDWIAVKKASGLSIFRVIPNPTRRQYNKLNGDLAIREAQRDPKSEHHLIDEIVISLVAMKSVAA
jgi:Kinase binding protein CGI-121